MFFKKKKKQTKKVVIDVIKEELAFLSDTIDGCNEIMEQLNRQEWAAAKELLSQFDLVNTGYATLDYIEFTVCAQAIERAKFLLQMEYCEQAIVEVRIAQRAANSLKMCID